MNIQVIYQSKSGRTKKVAEAIAAQCGVQAIDITVPHTLPETDLLFVGMGIFAGKPDHIILDYLDQLPANRIKGAAIFSTSATGKDQTELAANLLRHKGITLYSKTCTLPGKFLFLRRGHPDEKDIQKAKAFAQEVLDAVQQ